MTQRPRIEDLTSAEMIFLGMAGMEDAQIKAGAGPVKRDFGVQDDRLMGTAELAEMHRAKQPGGTIAQTIEEMRRKQAPLRAKIEEQALAMMDDGEIPAV